MRMRGAVLGGALGAVMALTPVLPLRSHAESAPAVAEGPFGIHMGERLADLGPVKDLGGHDYKVLNPARPNAKFPYVLVHAFPSTGVCRITGHAEMDDDPTSAKAVAMADDLAATLKAKYGEYDKVDRCDGDVASCRSLRAALLNVGRATYVYEWRFAGAPRPDKLAGIILGVDGMSAVDSAVQLIYVSADQQACDAAERAADAGSL